MRMFYEIITTAFLWVFFMMRCQAWYDPTPRGKTSCDVDSLIWKLHRCLRHDITPTPQWHHTKEWRYPESCHVVWRRYDVVNWLYMKASRALFVVEDVGTYSLIVVRLYLDMSNVDLRWYVKTDTEPFVLMLFCGRSDLRNNRHVHALSDLQ